MARSENSKAAGLMVASMAAFSLNDACVKGLSTELPFYQAMFIRGVGTAVLLTVLVAVMGQLKFDLPRRDWGRIILRSLAEIGAAFGFLTALYHMPLSNAVAILQFLPLSVALGAALFLGEPLGWRRLVAIGIGFLGMLLIIKPGSAGFTIYSLAAFSAVIMVTLRDLAARKLSPQVPSMLVALIAAYGVTIAFGVGAAVTDWQPISPKAMALLGGAVVLIMAGYVLSVMVMRTGDVGFVAPFRYSALLFGLLLGVFVFGDRPDMWTLIGALIILVTGLFTLYRERQARRQST